VGQSIPMRPGAIRLNQEQHTCKKAKSNTIRIGKLIWGWGLEQYYEAKSNIMKPRAIVLGQEQQIVPNPLHKFK
jgi:hypothetical protein